MGSSLNFLIGSDLAGVLEDEDDVDAEAAGCLALLASILVDAVGFQWPKPVESRAIRSRNDLVNLSPSLVRRRVACRSSKDRFETRRGRLAITVSCFQETLPNTFRS
jgi:hypothetical protein